MASSHWKNLMSRVQLRGGSSKTEQQTMADRMAMKWTLTTPDANLAATHCSKRLTVHQTMWSASGVSGQIYTSTVKQMLTQTLHLLLNLSTTDCALKVDMTACPRRIHKEARVCPCLTNGTCSSKLAVSMFSLLKV